MNDSDLTPPPALPTEVERQLKMYKLQQKGLLVLAGAVLGFFGRGLMGGQEKSYSEEQGNNAPQVAQQQPAAAQPPQGQPNLPPALDPKVAEGKLRKEALSSVIGNKNAKVSIYEFTDFQCPACQGAALQFLPQLKEQYVKTGKAKIVLVHWPLTAIHPSAVISAKAALCAEQQGGFEKFHDALFTKQQEWGSLDKSDAAQATVKQNMIKMAKEQGLNEGKFTSCISSSKYDEGLRRNGQLAFELGAQGTPTFYVDGKRVLNGQEIISAVEAGLKQ